MSKAYLLRQLRSFFSSIVSPAIATKGDTLAFNSTTNVLSLKSGNTVLSTQEIPVSSGNDSPVTWTTDSNGNLFAHYQYDDGT
jgi:hypothetical protein